MVLPCGVALVYDNLARNRRAEAGRGPAAWFSTDGSRNWLLGLLVLIGLAGLLLSYSRAGIALGVSAVGLTLLTAGRGPGLKLRVIVTVLVIAAALTPLMQVGADRLLQSYSDSPNELHGARVRVWLDSLSLIAAQPLVGCGFGAFSASYPLVRSPEVRTFFAYAHNDILQLLTEGGAAGLLLLLLLLIPLLDQVVRSIGGAKGTLAVGVAAGLVAVMLQSLVDFPFHMPANAAVAAILAGSLLGLPWKHRA
jgi:O-antigen ligase